MRTVEEVRAVLAARTEKCCDECAGWVVAGGGGWIERCDECSWYAALAGLPEVSDEECAQLPEAEAERLRVLEAADGYISEEGGDA